MIVRTFRTEEGRLHPFFLCVFFCAIVVAPVDAIPAPLPNVSLSFSHGVSVVMYTSRAGVRREFPLGVPLFSFLLNDTLMSAESATARASGDSIVFHYANGLAGSVRRVDGDNRGWSAVLRFVNSSAETLVVANVVPLGQGGGRVYITATGPSTPPNWLSRSALFRPGLGPIGVVLPDNAWELGFCDLRLEAGVNLVGLARRGGSQNASERRFRTILPPGGSVWYRLVIDDHGGDWHDGLELMFRKRWLYDLKTFNDSLYRRADLQWVRHAYLMTILFAWDEEYYDRFSNASTFDNFIDARTPELGPYDVFVLWPTWPRLGLDQRNQFDLYHDLPGGLQEIRRQAEFMHGRGGKYFVSYNPWDESTRTEAHLQGMTELLRATDADGVVLDTWGASSKEFQAAVDSVKPGIVLYSEGMAVPEDMPGIVTGRVHDALFMPPPLNLNKYIKPESAIFRVMQVAEGRLHREAAVCLFNGYGAELNTMRAGRPASLDEDYRYLGRVVKILRDNSDAFLSRSWEPLLPAATDSVWVNRWPASDKTVFTVYSLRPEGFAGGLFLNKETGTHHYVSLWHHRELAPAARDGAEVVPVQVEGFSRDWLGTRQEGNVDCIACLPTLLSVRRDGDSLYVYSAKDSVRIVVSAGNPGFDTPANEFHDHAFAMNLAEAFGHHGGKFVVQLFQGKELADERIVEIPVGTPHLLAASGRTTPASRAPDGMREIPAGTFSYSAVSLDDPNPVIPAPDLRAPAQKTVARFFIDTYPVTNAQFERFLRSSKYRPDDTVNFLREWRGGRPVPGTERQPVVWVSLDDARAYAQWAGKRLPTDVEWQYAAQGTDGREYPWGNAFDSTRCNWHAGHPTAVDAYPSGKSPFGVEDLVGNVWQLTDDVYDDGSYVCVMMRGGSWFAPTSSVWYVQGGPRPVNQHQMLLLVSPGYDRSSTVGFRCVKDAQ
ncbi:MAG TPA: SUMF1/EgtB/PvdO family nonheme iron enzyme [Bacteroidota bacterium]|nr:SUMF1/EgtB/PvdO family nonheme iron enzyme [Bacteroidota bacterium]